VELGGERNGRQEVGGGEVEWKARARCEAELKAGGVKAWRQWEVGGRVIRTGGGWG
jgi:hypothetical protein